MNYPQNLSVTLSSTLLFALAFLRAWVLFLFVGCKKLHNYDINKLLISLNKPLNHMATFGTKAKAKSQASNQKKQRAWAMISRAKPLVVERTYLRASASPAQAILEQASLEQVSSDLVAKKWHAYLMNKPLIVAAACRRATKKELNKFQKWSAKNSAMHSSLVEQFARLLCEQVIEITNKFTNHECEQMANNWSRFTGIWQFYGKNFALLLPAGLFASGGSLSTSHQKIAEETANHRCKKSALDYKTFDTKTNATRQSICRVIKIISLLINYSPRLAVVAPPQVESSLGWLFSASRIKCCIIKTMMLLFNCSQRRQVVSSLGWLFSTSQKGCFMIKKILLLSNYSSRPQVESSLGWLTSRKVMLY